LSIVTVSKASITARLEVVDRWLAAYSDRNVAAMCAVADPEIEIVPVQPLLTKLPGATFRAHEGVRTLAEWSYETYPRLRMESNTSRNVRGLVLASSTYIVDDRPTPVVKRHTESLFDVHGDLIRRVRSFLKDSDALAAAQADGMLTGREREVFQLLAGGMSAPEIAEQLCLSPATVRTHVQNGVSRLGARTRVQAISIALNRGEIHA
jgi:DNA-binding CsgD family transcriptional regulator